MSDGEAFGTNTAPCLRLNKKEKQRGTLAVQSTLSPAFVEHVKKRAALIGCVTGFKTLVVHMFSTVFRQFKIATYLLVSCFTL